MTPSRTAEPVPAIRVAGSADRDARDIPYEAGNRRARRAMNAKVSAAARGLRRTAEKKQK